MKTQAVWKKAASKSPPYLPTLPYLTYVFTTRPQGVY